MRAIKTTVIDRWRDVGALVAAGAVAHAMFLGAASAHANPDPDPPVVDAKASCESPEITGVFTAGVDDAGVPRSICQYSVEGYAYYDHYENGAYTGTTVYRDGAQVPTPRPEIPSLFELPAGLPMPF